MRPAAPAEELVQLLTLIGAPSDVAAKCDLDETLAQAQHPHPRRVMRDAEPVRDQTLRNGRADPTQHLALFVRNAGIDDA